MGNPSIMQSGMILATVAAICTTLVALTFSLTRDRIAANEQAFLEQSLTPVLAGKSFDNDLMASALMVPAPHELPGTENAVIYRALATNKPVAALFAGWLFGLNQISNWNRRRWNCSRRTRDRTQGNSGPR
jgi:electron transport complex protein RnfG